MKINLNTVLLLAGVVFVMFAVGQWSCMTEIGNLIPPSRREMAFDFALPVVSPGADPLPDTSVEPPPETPVEPVPADDDGLWRLSDQRGSAVFIVFWKSWSDDCVKGGGCALAITKNLHESFASKGVEFVSIGFKETKGTVSKIVRVSGLPYPSLYDADGSIASGGFDVGGYENDVPACLAVDAQGRVAAHFIGFNKKSFEAQVTTVLDALVAEGQTP